jgi:apolipoprotein N-acyltransferase
VDTPYGRLGTVICQDDFFPSLLRQAGRRHVDILLVPTSDWPAIADWHAELSSFRAVENGVAVVRPTRWGISLATDALGRTIAAKPDTGTDRTLFAAVPTQGRSTVYARIGDVFAYLCLALLIAFVPVAVRRRRTTIHSAGRQS